LSLSILIRFNFNNNIFFYLFYIKMFNMTELIKRIIKYLIEGLMVAIAAFAIPKRSLNIEEIALLALTAAATFAILDTYIPSMGVTARSGAGFGIGANLVGFPGGL
jgi:ABC-type Co2+ transport system permease subunit